MAKTTIGRSITAFAPSIETARRIDAQDNALAVQAAVYRAEAKLAELRSLYESQMFTRPNCHVGGNRSVGNRGV